MSCILAIFLDFFSAKVAIFIQFSKGDRNSGFAVLSLPHSIFLPVGKSPWQPFYPYHSPGGFLYPAGVRYAMA